MENFRLTVGQLNKAIDENKYIIVRDAYNNLYGVNCAVFRTKIGIKRRRKHKPETRLIYTGYYPCDLHEYINYKNPII